MLKIILPYNTIFGIIETEIVSSFLWWNEGRKEGLWNKKKEIKY